MAETVDGVSETEEATPRDATPRAATPPDTASLAGADGSGARAPTADLHLLGPGDALDRYRITAVLGAGGMGRVYRARDPDLNRELAIKVLRRGGAPGSNGLAPRLMREAQAMARLKHENLAIVYDVGAVGGEVFIAFELIDGTTLARWMRAPQRTTAERLRALCAAGRGLAAAHSAGVIHRDFKPENVLVAHDGQVKVVDFGLARSLSASDDPPPPPTTTTPTPPAPSLDILAIDLTATGSILGTPAYMSPEQHRGRDADARADQFSFAVSAWESLHGERPFHGTDLESLRDAICSGRIAPPPPDDTRDVPPAVETALRRALAVDPAARFPDMTALLAAIDATIAPPATAPDPPSRLRRLHWVVYAGAAVVLIAAAIVAFAMATHDWRASPEPMGKIPRDEIVRAIRKRADEVRACYEHGADLDPSIDQGIVTVIFEIAATGKVQSTRIARDDFNGAYDIATCIARVSLTWQFPKPVGGKIVVTYPFNFHRDPLSPSKSH